MIIEEFNCLLITKLKRRIFILLLFNYYFGGSIINVIHYLRIFSNYKINCKFEKMSYRINYFQDSRIKTGFNLYPFLIKIIIKYVHLTILIINSFSFLDKILMGIHPAVN